MRKRRASTGKRTGSAAPPATLTPRAASAGTGQRLLTPARLALLTDSGMAAAWCVVAVAVLVNSVPEHAVGTGSVTRDLVKAFLPEGWAFFTRNPREQVEHFFEELPNGQLVPAAAADVRGVPSASRWERVRSIEIALVVDKIPSAAWVPCEATLQKCVSGVRERVEVALTMNACSYSGPAVLQRIAPVPWAWRASYDEVVMPSRVVRVNIRCSKPERA